MKTFWTSKCFNSFYLNSALTKAGKSRLLLHYGSRLSGFRFKSTALAHDVRWHPFWQRTTIQMGFRELTVCARKFHANNIFGTSNQGEKKPETLQELVEASEKQETAVTVGQKGALLWYVLSELFLSSSPNKVYSDALKKVKRKEEVVDAIGEPIKAYGEETSRGRRRHVSFQEYIVAGENYMRVKFYVAGQHRKGTVHVDVKQVSSRKYEYRFIFVELDGFPPRTIIIEDNR